ncbi:VanW family protein [Streptomyces sp. NPDC008265]|uniref:VanW family protein n=1 Tax=Streptomyces sp. NPDC008265 TaxID=3364824 RepID=UPI0036EF33A7
MRRASRRSTRPDGARRRTAARIGGLAAGAAAVGFGGLYAAGLLLTGDEVAPGTKVRGVPIGGMGRAEAARTLDRELGPAASAPLALRIGERTERASPATLGLSLDSTATVERAAPSGSAPFTVIRRLFASGDPEVRPAVRLDERAARGSLDALAKSTATPVREGSVLFEKGKARAVTPVTGTGVDVDGALDALRSGYLRAGGEPVTLPVRRTEPKVGREETERALREFAEPALSAPVTLTVSGKRLPLSPAVLSKHLSLKDDGRGRLVPGVDAAALLADPAVAGPLRQAVPPPVEAGLRLDASGRVTVAEEGKAGRKVSEQALSTALLPLLTGGNAAARTGEVATEAAAPRLSRETVDRLGIKEEVSSFTVGFERAAYRTTNIGRAAELIDGSLVLPDETWSFNRTVGERTKENGFVDGLIINNGQYEKASGGGVSAVATTVFNAVFFAGVRPVEYGAHSFYIERYPEGREATVAWGSLDLRFTNDSGKALYIKAEATDTSVTITFLGTKKYEAIRADHGPRTNVVQPAERSGKGPKCEPQTPLVGFDVAVDRVFQQGGREVKRETMKTRYTPRDKVTCEA